VLNLTKITLSTDELQLVNNSEWILTKRQIIDKSVALFGQACESMRDIIRSEENSLPAVFILSEPKISKGENYRQLPYVILDYPRYFDASSIFAIRTMMWWGNFFSMTLHLAGEHKKDLEKKITANIEAIRSNAYFICISENQWQHHFEEDNYIPGSSKTREELQDILRRQPFIKIARRFTLSQWNEMPAILERSFSEMIQLVKT